MNIKANKKELLNALLLAKSVAEKEGVMPVLADALLHFVEEQFTVSATDLVTSVSTSVSVKGSSCVGVGLPAKLLHEAVSKVPGEEVTIKLEGSIVEVKGGGVRYKLPFDPEGNFPALPKPPKELTKLAPSEVLIDLLNKTVYATSSDPTHPQMCGVRLIAANGIMQAVATDGVRLSTARALVTKTASIAATIPAKGSALLLRVLVGEELAGIALCNDVLYCSIGRVAMSSKLIMDAYPPWEQIVPRFNQMKVQVAVGRAELLAAIDRVAFLSATNIGVVFHLSPDACTLSTSNANKGDAEVPLDCECSEKTSVCLHPQYVCDAATRATDEKLRLGFGGELDPVVVLHAADDDYIAVIMPMRA
jgi:DNA polymerase-3 subunit beta